MQEAGLSHGDLHFGNIFVGDGNQLQVLDFDDSYELKDWEIDLSFQLEYFNFVRFTCIMETCNIQQLQTFKFCRKLMDIQVLDYTSRNSMWTQYEVIDNYKSLCEFMSKVKKERHTRSKGHYYRSKDLKRCFMSMNRSNKRICPQ